jgi:tRNA (mo5U34)-methyltransferase
VAELLERAREQGWYHTLELPGGEITPGIFDLRPYVRRYGIPERLDGMRALEVGTWDGFWAFELERRGAEVVALDLDDERDLDWPPRRRPATFPDEPRGKGFALARELLGSSVDRRNLSIYGATPDELGGQFDLVFCGSVLLHLRDQLLALEHMAELTKPGGLLISAEEYDRLSSLIPFPVSRYRADREAAVVFWLPAIKTWARMLWTAGYDDVRRHSRFKMRAAEGWSVPHVVHHARKAG